MLQNRRLTFSRNRAETAFRNVKDIIESHQPVQKKYKSLVRKTPMRIKVNGLGATLAFMFSKKKKAHHNLLYEQLKTWLGDNDMVDNNEELVAYVIALEKAKYRVVTNEVLVYLTWLRRFADGMIEGEEDDE
jgi:CRISPR-associated protein Cmr5